MNLNMKVSRSSTMLMEKYEKRQIQTLTKKEKAEEQIEQK